MSRYTAAFDALPREFRLFWEQFDCWQFTRASIFLGNFVKLKMTIIVARIDRPAKTQRMRPR
jgi:hypothetical protein